MGARAAVAAARVPDYSLETLRPHFDRMLDALGGASALACTGERVLVKPNLLEASVPEAAVCTHPSVVEVVLERIVDAGARPILADSPAYGTVEQVARALGLEQVARRFGAELRRFGDPRSASSERMRVFDELTVDGLALDADRVVNVAKLKTHRQVLYTGAVKNLFGCVPGRRKAWWHVKAGAYGDYFARMLVDVAALVAPTLSVLDGIDAMEGEGPRRGTPRRAEVLLASRDPVALDRVAVEIAGIDPDRVSVLVAAGEMGWSGAVLGAIDVLGADLDALRLDPPLVLPRLVPLGFSLPRLVRGSVRQAWLERRGAGVGVGVGRGSG